MAHTSSSVADESEDTLSIAIGAAVEAVEAKRSGEWVAPSKPKHEPKQAVAGFLASLDKTTLAMLIGLAGILTTQADKWWASMLHDDETAISRAVDERVAAGFDLSDEHARVDALRSKITALEDDLADIEAEVAGARAVRQAIADRVGDTRERLVRVEALQGVD